VFWCRRNRHVWVDTETCVYVQSRYAAEEFCYLAECEHCDACRWVRLSSPALVVRQYDNYAAAMYDARAVWFVEYVMNAHEVHV
jgi:hypothetical protein